ncbi:sterol desaturase/sphingolipid hydroxylase (fatty acid hydroxylase superfamily) [Cytobacillus eiseniae]|uniref:Sterol desaturase/sphingolipid hydroxylase (Fatty acid hydroxylase superfamily) n=1 Tax=Cytobacillus eiseniae TaxID=762947 RepID=A0ABS4RGW7_9BACI|nr:sterol desaturase family protein [Cytobacillus eiseniae]MBP2242133.1 sterol desaturase/sphingolipid hydroxylase (fatty acid hydroxylase superfamily) [Cytobacillus eiseniae]
MKKKGLYRDFFLHFDILFMLVVFSIATVFVLVKGVTWVYMLFFIIGLVTYMFTEYLTHRYFFHLKTPKNPFFLKLLKRLHYDHHKHPNDLKLLFLPLWYSIPNLLIAAGIFFLIVQSVVGTISFITGTILMLLIYEWKHYVAHRPIKPKTKLGIWVKKTHTLHHYKNENYWYGVSTPFVDVLFGTLKNEKEVETSQTAKDLEKRAK